MDVHGFFKMSITDFAARWRFFVTELLPECYGGVTEVLRLCYGSVTVVLRRCYGNVTAVSRRCDGTIFENFIFFPTIGAHLESLFLHILRFPLQWNAYFHDSSSTKPTAQDFF